MKKQLIVICDMEGVLGIFEKNKHLLKNGTEEWYKLEALENVDNAKCIDIKAPYKFSMTLTNEYVYSVPDNVSWKGHFEDKVAYWEAPSIEIGLEIFNYVRNCLKKYQ